MKLFEVVEKLSPRDLFLNTRWVAMDSKKPKWRRLELVRRGRTSKGKQWEDEQKSKKRKVDEYSTPLPIYCLDGFWVV